MLRPTRCSSWRGMTWRGEKQRDERLLAGFAEVEEEASHADLASGPADERAGGVRVL